GTEWSFALTARAIASKLSLSTAVRVLTCLVSITMDFERSFSLYVLLWNDEDYI
ncbi:unnamed protein product, partial [Larinioides sclopetarius]